MKKILLCLTLYLSTIGLGLAEALTFELYRINENGERVLVEQGSKRYSIADFVVTPEHRGGKLYGYSKEIELANGYSVGLLDTYDASRTGFGLWVNHLPLATNPNDFSWEWFSKVGEKQFRKLQGGAIVDIDVIKHPQGEELVYLKFRSDVKLDYKEDICCKKPGDFPSHMVILKAGSVLVFPTIAPNKAADSQVFQIIGSWQLYRDDDLPEGPTPKETLDFWANGKLLVSGDHPNKGLYRINGNQLEFLIKKGGRALIAKRQFELSAEELRFKNDKIGWVYYKRVSEQPKGEEPDLR